MAMVKAAAMAGLVGGILADRCTASHPPRYSGLERVHAFYYLWYGNPETEGRYQHWNHEVLEHWDPAIARRHPSKMRFVPPDEIHAPFYPARGPYSSSDRRTLDAQFGDMVDHGVGVAALSWWGQAAREGTHDTQGVQTDLVINEVIAAAEKSRVKVCFHLEPYPGRSAASVLDDVRHLNSRFGNYSSMLRPGGGDDARMLFYVYDSYHIPAADWKAALAELRGTEDDGVFLGLWLNGDGGAIAVDAGFDGTYTYFASNGFSYGSSTQNWASMKRFSEDNGLLFVPSVGPGYDDRGIRPWNAHNTKSREGGAYYDRMWSAALDAGGDLVGITSYNEWGEGTQVEAAVPKTISTATVDGGLATGSKRTYKDYGAGGPNFYMERTAVWAARLMGSDSPAPRTKSDL